MSAVAFPNHLGEFPAALPGTPLKFFSAVSSMEGKSITSFLLPEALSNTPALPTSVNTFPPRFPFLRSVSPRRFAATNWPK